MGVVKLTKADILRLFHLLDAELGAVGAEGEVYLVGGAVMCLVLNARESTKHIDAFFKPTKVLREASARVAARANVPDNWLNDAVKRYLSPRGEFAAYLELQHLRVFVAKPEYLLAMKCASMRLGEEFHDLDDIRYLLRYLNIENPEDAMAIVRQYYDDSHLLPKTRLALDELLS